MTIPKGTLAVTLFLLFPLIIWLILQLTSSPISSLFSIFFLAKTLGVLGLTSFTLALLLAVRIPLQERIFGDLGTSYRAHQLIGTGALIALLLHMILLFWSYAQFSLTSAFSLITPTGDTAKILGILGLSLMAICIFITYYVRLPYHIWKTTHKFLSLAFLLGTLHGIFIQGDIQTMPLLKGVFFIFLILGIGVIFYRVLFHRIFVRRTPYVVSAIKTINEKFVDVTLAPKEKGIAVKPGQFAYVTYKNTHIKPEEHPFTIAGSSSNGTLRFITKLLGDFTNTLPCLAVGDEALIEGPYGSFSFLEGSKTQLWIAGGIGITPFLTFADHLPADYKATLFYSIRDNTENAITDDIKRLSKEKPNLTVIIWNNKENEFLTAATALANLNPLTTDIFLCGSGPMIKSLRTQFDTLNVPHHHIHQEKFSLKP